MMTEFLGVFAAIVKDAFFFTGLTVLSALFLAIWAVVIFLAVSFVYIFYLEDGLRSG